MITYNYGPSTGSGYHLGRISQQSGNMPEYFLGDALGSVRQLTDQASAIKYAAAYDPYGNVASASGASVSAYGYTGEMQDASGMVYLRARVYSPNAGRFLSRDTWGGHEKRPMSYNKWQYVYSNPVNFIDPTGYFPLDCQTMPIKALYELCVLKSYGLEPISYSELGNTVQGEKGCYSGPAEYRAPGYLEGTGGWLFVVRSGHEMVYDFATMERENFIYNGFGINDVWFIGIGGGQQAYVGRVKGFRTDDSIANQYRAFSGSITVGGSGDIGLFGGGGGGGNFWSWTDFRLRGNVAFVGWSLSLDVLEGVDIDFSPFLYYQPDPVTRERYILPDGSIRKGDMINDILAGKNSPVHYLGEILSPIRSIAANSAMKYANAYEELRNDDSH